MLVKKLFYITFLVTIYAITTVLTLSIIARSPQTIQAAPPADGPPQFYETYQIFEDGGIIITRTQLSSKQILQATQVCTKTPPLLSEPVDGEQLDNLVPDYKFLAISDTFRYHLQVSAYDTFSETVRGVTLLTSNPISGQQLSVGSLDNLLPDTTYYWHVASQCEDREEGEYSSTRSFRTSSSGGTFLSASTLLAPDDGALVGSIRVIFQAEEVNNAEKYQFRLYNSAPTGWGGWFLAISPSAPRAQYTFDPQETFYWRVAARNSYAWGTPSISRSFTTPSVTVTTTISPGSGGTLTPSPGNISIQFPPGAVTETTTLSYTLHPKPTKNLANFRFAGRAFTINALDSTGPITQFNKPFTLTIVYDSADILAANIGDTSKLNLAFWNGSEWENILPCSGCSIDTENRIITVVIDHLTEFALLAPIERFVFLPIVLK